MQNQLFIFNTECFLRQYNCLKWSSRTIQMNLIADFPKLINKLVIYLLIHPQTILTKHFLIPFVQMTNNFIKSIKWYIIIKFVTVRFMFKSVCNNVSSCFFVEMKGYKNDEIKITAKFISGWINF